MGDVVKRGSKVSVLYEGKLSNGEVFDSNKGSAPFGFTAGGTEVIPGMSREVVGMKVGETKIMEIEAEDAYGPRRDDLMAKVLRDSIPPEIKVGDSLSDGQNQHVTWTVIELTDEHAVVDGNHPLAGEKLIFDVELLSIEGE